MVPGATATAQQGTLLAVSCSSAKACTAVGTYDSRTGLTLVERWNGTKWATEPSPSPGAARSSELDAVSCASATACTGVGSYVNSAGAELTLAQAWNGKKWMIDPTPPTGGNYSFLNGVSCVSVRACIAVGSYTNSRDASATLAEIWNGTKWTIESTPNEAGRTNSSLYGASCTSATACVAVGSYTVVVSPGGTIAERWNGKKWTLQRSPNAVYGSSLSGVSCTAANACTAVGSYQPDPEYQRFATLAEAWNGKKWSAEVPPNPPGRTASSLSGISCTAANACVAVGTYYHSSAGYVTLVDAWNGTSWEVKRAPTEIGALYGVSCASAKACAAVGSYANSKELPDGTLAEIWNGTKWTIEPTP
jgi:hypothetical protein